MGHNERERRGNMTSQENVFMTEMDSHLGPLTILATKNGVCHIQFGRFERNQVSTLAKLKKLGLHGDIIENEHEEIMKIAVEQLNEYFAGERKEFTVPLDIYGTNFQQKVWLALKEIEYGKTSSYKAVAERIGAPKAVRAIGGANNKNPIPIIIPCHRVIGSNGNMVGYGGGLDKKKTLLMLEGYFPIEEPISLFPENQRELAK